MKTLIISDLHLGNGGPYDVFEGQKALPALLDNFGASPIRVLVNGDGVDFLMNEDPLELDEGRAVAQAQAIAQNPASAAVFHAFGRVLARGGQVTIRLGNHDIELAFVAVQAVFRGALGQPQHIADKLEFSHGDAPEILTLGGARILVTHGEQDDRWNKVDYEKLRAGDKRYVYAPGSVLVKKILNPGTSKHGMRFLSLLKPDFQGAALSALAVDPSVAKQIFKGATLGMLAQLFQRKGMVATFADDEAAEEASVFDNAGSPPPTTDELGFSGDDAEHRLELAHLNEEEREAMESLFNENAIANFAGDDESILGSAAVKIGKAALSLYGRLQRRMTGNEGDCYFALEPMPDEWTEAKRLADKFKAGAVIIGHTHAARWKEEGAVVYANTGTWIGLMQLPQSDAHENEWAEYLLELRQNKGLDAGKQERARILTRFTAVIVDADVRGGAVMSLVEWDGAAMKTLGQTRVPSAA
jgi:UDP-2,3-diacylglucosamine pyrophosphatase LpxH